MMATANSYLAIYLKQPYIGVSDELSHGVASIVEVTIGNKIFFEFVTWPPFY